MRRCFYGTADPGSGCHARAGPRPAALRRPERDSRRGALRARDGGLSGPLAQALWEIARVLGSTAAGTGIGVFALATAAVAFRTGLILPRWVAIVTAIIGATLLSPVSYVGEVAGGALIV